MPPIPVVPGRITTHHSLIGELFLAGVGVAAFTIVASTSERIGKVLFIIMLGFLLIWFMIHGQVFTTALQKLNMLGSSKG